MDSFLAQIPLLRQLWGDGSYSAAKIAEKYLLANTNLSAASPSSVSSIALPVDETIALPPVEETKEVPEPSDGAASRDKKADSERQRAQNPSPSEEASPLALRVVSRGSAKSGRSKEAWESLRWAPIGRTHRKPRSSVRFQETDARLRELGWELPSDAVLGVGRLRTSPKFLRCLLLRNLHGIALNLPKKDPRIYSFFFQALSLILNSEAQRRVQVVCYAPPDALPLPPAQLPASVRHVAFVFPAPAEIPPSVRHVAFDFPAPAEENSRSGRSSYWAFAVFSLKERKLCAFIPECCWISKGQLDIFQKYLHGVDASYTISDAGLRYAHGIAAEEPLCHTFHHHCEVLCRLLPFPGHFLQEPVLGIVLGFLAAPVCDHMEVLLRNVECGRGCSERLQWLRDPLHYNHFIRHSLGRVFSLGRFQLDWFLSPWRQKERRQLAAAKLLEDSKPIEKAEKTNPSFELPLKNRFMTLAAEEISGAPDGD